jgi:uncharacterized protein
VGTIIKVKISFDPKKNLRNIAERGLPFELVDSFEWDTAFIAQDNRKDYGEQRYIAVGFIDEVLYVTVFTPRNDRPHVISLRRANLRERRKYATQTESSKN